jgi:hypothetical protein
VVLLVLGSLSNVVGYQSVKSTAVNDSPLFKTQMQRATNQQQNIITSQYIGKGTGNLLQFPPGDNKTKSLKNIFESIKKMNDATFQQFLLLVQQRLRETTSLNNKQLYELDNELAVIRKQVSLRILSPSEEPPTTMILCGFTVHFINCLFLFIIMILAIINDILYFILFNILKLPSIQH